MRFVVDTSAILAIARTERGAEDAERLARGGLLGMANFVEAVARGAELGHETATTLRIVSTLSIELAPVDRETAEQANALWRHRKHGLSLGDRLCIGLARTRSLPALTGDRAWKDFELGIKVVLFR